MMIIFIRFKTFLYFSFSIFAIMVFSSTLYAESVFINDGSIVEGKIVKEDDKKIQVQTPSGEIKVILRTEILRTLYHTKYKDKKFFSKTDKTTIEAYIVDEDAENYTCRTSLNSPNEIKISKNDIKSISKEKIIEQYNIPTGYYLRGIIPGWGQFYSGHYVKGTVFGLSFISSATWAVIACLNYNESKNEYNTLSAGHTPAEFDDAYEKKTKDGNLAMWSVITVSAVYVLNWCDILFFSRPEPGDSVSIFRYGEVNLDLNLIPDNNDQGYNNNTCGLKARVDVFVRF